MKPLMLDEDSEEAQPPVQIPVQSETAVHQTLDELKDLKRQCNQKLRMMTKWMMNPCLIKTIIFQKK